MQKIIPFLWFNGNAEEAVNFYISVFKKGKIELITHYPEGIGPTGSVMTIHFKLYGQDFVALNGGPQFKFSPAISLLVGCETQREIDRLWEKLSAGGEKVECGWLTDKFGVSWQIAPAILPKLFVTAESTARVMKEVCQMKKLNIARMKKAARDRK